MRYLMLFLSLASPGAEPSPTPAPIPKKAALAEPANKVPGLELPADQEADPERQQFVRIEAKVEAKDGEVRFVVIGTTSEVAWDQSGNRLYVGVPRSGQVIVFAIASAGAGKLTEAARTVISVKGGGTDPVPSVGIKRPGAGQPGGKLFLAIVHDPAQTTPQQRAVMNDPALAEALRAAGHRLTVLSHTSPEIARLKIVSHVKRAGALPALVVWTPEPKVVYAGALPLTEAAWTELIRGLAP